jgi:hypothetical protein
VSELSREHGFGIVLLLVLASASVLVAAPDGDAADLASMALGAGTLAVSVCAARAEHALARAAVLAAATVALGSIVVLVIRGSVPDSAAGFVNGLLIAFAPVVIGRGLLRDVRAEGTVSIRTLSGVLAIYLRWECSSRSSTAL